MSNGNSMVSNGNFSCQKMPIKFFCETCLYTCSKESNYKSHLLTRKHQNGNKMVTNGNNGTKNAVRPQQMPFVKNNITLQHKSVTKKNAKTSVGKNAIFQSSSTPYICQACGQEYKHASGLSRHRKTCSTNVDETHDQLINIPPPNNQADFKELVIMLLKENKEFQKTFVEMIPHIKGNAEHSYNNTNSNNTNNFNIQMFLNEHCKNAMNITDFIDSLPVTAETYDNTIENGLTKSITTMITNGLNKMDILERPIHCTDPSRKIMYIKDNDVWEKDTELNRLLSGITMLVMKQRTNINKWQDVNVGWDKDDNLQTKLTTIVCHSMTDIVNDEKEMSKIYRAIGKNTYLTNEIKNGYK